MNALFAGLGLAVGFVLGVRAGRRWEAEENETWMKILEGSYR